MAIKRKNKVTAEFNMSSMTDIIFLLLIFFMLSSTLVSTNALNLTLPSSTAKTQTKSKSVEIDIKDGQFYIAGTPVAEVQLEARIKERVQKEFGSSKEVPALIIACAKETPIDDITKVLTIAATNNWKALLSVSPAAK